MPFRLYIPTYTYTQNISRIPNNIPDSQTKELPPLSLLLLGVVYISSRIRMCIYIRQNAPLYMIRPLKISKRMYVYICRVKDENRMLDLFSSRASVGSV